MTLPCQRTIFRQAWQHFGNCYPRRHPFAARRGRCRSFASGKYNVEAFPPETQVVFVSSVLPEPHATAAGVRTEILLRLLAQSSGIQRIHYMTGASTTTSCATDTVPSGSNASCSDAQQAKHETQRRLQENHGVEFVHMPANQSQRMQEWISQTVSHCNNVLVLFDRFFVEEMYSWLFQQALADRATLVLDMQDWHSLRSCREKAIQANDLLLSTSGVRPRLDDFRFLREMASIQRSDLTLVCSKFEQGLLQQHYQVAPWKMCASPLLLSDSEPNQLAQGARAWDERTDLCFVGNFYHAPNVDAVKQLYTLWPRLMQEGLPPSAQLHIYGAYHERLHNHVPLSARSRKFKMLERFHVHGYCDNLTETLSASRLLVAPLRFGAGLKGKIVEAWKHGLPVVTTSIGSEGLTSAGDGDDNDDDEFAGVVADNYDAFVQGVTRLYSNESDCWNDAQGRIAALLPPLGMGDTLRGLVDAVQNRRERRQRDVSRAIMWHSSLQSTKYFSQLIECRKQSRDANNEEDVR